jgi:hypothetical protein
MKWEKCEDWINPFEKEICKKIDALNAELVNGGSALRVSTENYMGMSFAGYPYEPSKVRYVLNHLISNKWIGNNPNAIWVGDVGDDYIYCVGKHATVAETLLSMTTSLLEIQRFVGKPYFEKLYSQFIEVPYSGRKRSFFVHANPDLKVRLSAINKFSKKLFGVDAPATSQRLFTCIHGASATHGFSGVVTYMAHRLHSCAADDEWRSFFVSASNEYDKALARTGIKAPARGTKRNASGGNHRRAMKSMRTKPSTNIPLGLVETPRAAKQVIVKRKRSTNVVVPIGIVKGVSSNNRKTKTSKKQKKVRFSEEEVDIEELD